MTPYKTLVVVALLGISPDDAPGQTSSASQAVAFAPGGQELFALNPAGSPVGGSVRLLSGRFDVVTQDGQRMLRAAEPTEVLITLAQRLPENFTIEVDLIPKQCCPPPDLTLEGTPEINQGTASAHLLWQADGYVAVVGGAENNREFPMPEDLQLELRGTLTQVGVSVQGKTIRLYTNGRELYAVEAQFARARYLRVTLGGGGGGDDGVVHPVYIARIRVATGAPAQALVALPAEVPTATITPMARPAAVKESSLGNCGLFTNLRVTASSLTTTRIRWDAINADCSSLAASQGMSLGSYDIVRWAGSNAAGCPTEYDDLGTFTQGDWWDPRSPAYPDCRFVGSGNPPVDDSRLDPGETYSYRLWAVFWKKCTAGAPRCNFGFEYTAYPSPQASVTLPLARFAQPALTIVPPPVRPQATVGKRQCGWTGGGCEVTVAYSWTPVGNAAGYILFFVLTEDRLDGAGTRPIIYGTRVIPPSPSPTYSESFSAMGGILRACIAIIYDATRPPNPLDGECIETQLP